MATRIPRQAIQWCTNTAYTLCDNVMTPFVLNGQLRVSLLHRSFSTRTAPGSNPQLTGWWTIIRFFGYRETKPIAFEWAALGVYQYCFCMLSAIKSYTAAGRVYGRRSHHGWVFGEVLPQPVTKKSSRYCCLR